MNVIHGPNKKQGGHTCHHFEVEIAQSVEVVFGFG